MCNKASQKGSGFRCQKLDHLFAMELLIWFWSASSPCQFWCQSFLLRWNIFPFCFGFTGRFSILGCTSWWTDSRHLGCCRSDVTWTVGSLFVYLAGPSLFYYVAKLGLSTNFGVSSDVSPAPWKDGGSISWSAHKKIRRSMPRLAGSIWEIPQMPCTKRSWTIAFSISAMVAERLPRNWLRRFCAPSEAMPR